MKLSRLRLIAFGIISISALSIILLFIRTNILIKQQNDHIVTTQVNYFNQINEGISDLLTNFISENETEIHTKIQQGSAIPDVSVTAYYQHLIDGYMLINSEHFMVQGEGDYIAVEGFEVCLNANKELSGIHTCPVSKNTILYSVLPVMMEDMSIYYVLFYKLISENLAKEISKITDMPVQFVQLGAKPEPLKKYTHKITVLKSFDNIDLIEMVSYYPKYIRFWNRIAFIIIFIVLFTLGVLAYIMTTISKVAALSRDLETKNTKLKTLSEEKESLLRVLSHDLKNYLSPIMGYSELMLMDDNLNESQKNMIKNIRNSALQQNRIIDLVRQQLALDSGKLSIELSAIDIKSSLDRIIHDFKFRLEEKNLSIQISDTAQCCKILADPLTFSVNVINNIVSNAIKFSFKDTVITIKVEKTKESKVQLIISDKGIGIPKSYIANLFDPSAKTSQKGTAGEEGTGFGMPLVKKFMEAYGGSISVVSRDIKDFPDTHGTDIILTFLRDK